MKKTKRFLLIIGVLLLVFITAVSAQISSDSVWYDMARIMTSTAKALTSSKMLLEGFLRFAIWVFIFAGLTIVNSRVENKNAKRAVIVLAIIVATYGALRVPYALLKGIFNLYYAIIFIIFAFLPAAAGFFLNQRVFSGKDRTNRIMRAIVYIMITIAMGYITTIIKKEAGPDKVLFGKLTAPLTIGTVLAFVAALVNLASAFGGDTAAKWIGEKLGRTPQPAGGAGTTGAGAGGGAGGAGTAPPPVNPAEVTRLQNEIRNFVTAVGNPTVGAGPAGHGTAGTGLFAVLEGAVQRYTAEIAVPALTTAAKKANATAHMTPLNLFQTEIGKQRKKMKDILDNQQYVNCGDPYKRSFEAEIAAFLHIECELTRVYYNTITWL